MTVCFEVHVLCIFLNQIRKYRTYRYKVMLHFLCARQLENANFHDLYANPVENVFSPKPLLAICTVMVMS